MNFAGRRFLSRTWRNPFTQLLRHARRGLPSGRRRPLTRGVEALERRVLPAANPFSLGAAGMDLATTVATDAVGNFYVAGQFEGTVDFDPGPSGFSLTSRGGVDAFVAKYAAVGGLLWARQFGGTADDFASDVAVDAAGNVSLVGSFFGTADFSAGTGGASLTSAGSYDGFVTRLDSSGNLLWAQSYGGTNWDRCQAVAVDAAGNLYLTGAFQNQLVEGRASSVEGQRSASEAIFPALDPRPLTLDLLTSNGGDDVFVLKLSTDGDLAWSRSMGGGDYDRGMDLAVDPNGFVVIAGTFRDYADLDPTAGTQLVQSQGAEDVFVTRLDGSGGFVWSKTLGGSGSDTATGLAVDAAGRIVLVGDFTGTLSLDPVNGPPELTSAGAEDVFVARFTAAGTLGLAQQFGGSGSDRGGGVTVDPAGFVTFTGQYRDTVDFDPGLGAANRTSAGSADAFLVRLDNAGNLALAQSYGGGGSDQGISVASTAEGNLVVVGTFTGTASVGVAGLTSNGGRDLFVNRVTTDPATFPLGFGGLGPDTGYTTTTDAQGNVFVTGAFSGTMQVGSTTLAAVGGTDAFLAKFNSTGKPQWAKSWGGTGTDRGNVMAVDAAGNVYVTGSFQNTVDFDPGPGSSPLSSTGSNDVFISKLDSDGNLVWAKAVGGSSADTGQGIAVDASGNVVLVGSFAQTVDFDPGPGVQNRSAVTPGSDVFVLKLDAAGNFAWVQKWGGNSVEAGLAITLDSTGNAYTTGQFSGTVDFDPGAATSNLSSTGSTDVFVSKLDSGGNFVWARSWGGGSTDSGNGIAVDSTGNVYTTGNFAATADFDPGAGIANRTSSGGSDVFVSKLDSSGNFAWARTWGGPTADIGAAVVVDRFGQVDTVGQYTGTVDFDPGAGVATHTAVAAEDIFLSRLTATGDLASVKTWGGTGSDIGFGLAADPQGNIVATGQFMDVVDFDPGGGPAPLTSAGAKDVFVTRLVAVGDPPAAQNDSYTVAEDASLTVSAAGVLANDADPEGGSLIPVVATRPAHGTLVFNADGSFQYTPQPDYNGSDAFTYLVSDARDGTAMATVTIDVTPANDPPVIANQSFSVAADSDAGAVAGTVAASDPDAGQSLSFSITAGNIGNAFAINGTTGQLTVNRPLDALIQSTYSLTVRVSDNAVPSLSNSATITVEVMPNRIILDDGDAGFSTTGVWSTATDQGAGGDVRYAAMGDGSAVASWTAAVTPGIYRVAATWSPLINRATDSPFTILDGDTARSGTRVNQEPPPDDFSDAGLMWSRLGGPVVIQGNRLTVQLTNQADEWVIADSVRIERLGSVPSGAEIAVLDGGTELVAGGSVVDFGAVAAGGSLSRTFTVRNLGGAALTLQPVTASGGFAVTANLTAGQTLATSDSARFTVRLDATTPGTYSGVVSLASSDADENPFEFTVSGTVLPGRIVDDGDAGFTTEQPWLVAHDQGAEGDVRYAPTGDDPFAATWTFAVTPGQYRVSATWSPNPNRATNAPYTIFDGDLALATVRVNQEQSPDDFTAGGIGWKDLGMPHAVTGNTLTVRLTNDADEWVIADAVRVERVADLPSDAEILATDGTQGLISGGSVMDFGTLAVGTPATKTFTVKNVGLSDLTVQPVSVPAGFTVIGNFAANQVIASGQSASVTVQLNTTTTGTPSGELSLASNDADENPFRVTIRGTVVPSVPLILDDGGAGFSTTGSWTNWTAEGFQRDLKYAAAGNGASKAVWSFGNLATGQYEVWTTWVPHPNRATDAPYTIQDGGTPLITVRINQERSPTGLATDGVNWQSLGTVTITGNTLVVELSDAANEYVLADAVRIEKTAAPTNLAPFPPDATGKQSSPTPPVVGLPPEWFTPVLRTAASPPMTDENADAQRLRIETGPPETDADAVFADVEQMTDLLLGLTDDAARIV